MLCIFLLISQFGFSQADLTQTASRIVHFIERNLKIEENSNNEPVYDFFVYDISIDSSGKISSMHTLIWDSISCIKRVNELADSIKVNYSFHKPRCYKFFVPVLVVSEKGQENQRKDLEALAETIKFFGLFKGQQKNGVYVTRLATVMVLANSGKNDLIKE